MPSLSVVIPTHERASILSMCLDHLASQMIADQIEVIVVSDGHDEDTATLLFDPPWTNLAIQFLEIPKSHQGIARNHGVKQASAPITLFIGDDILLDPRACEVHLRAHGRGGPSRKKNSQSSILNSPFAVLGFTTWDPSVGITPVMRWLERSGWQFDYGFLRACEHAFIPPSLQHRYTYTSHVSLPTALARMHHFREDTSLYGWEDIEWGMRLRQAGVPLFYEPDARALHHHHITLSASLERMETLGRSAVHFAEHSKDFDRVPRGWKLLAYRLLSLLPTMEGRHRKAFLRGMTNH